MAFSRGRGGLAAISSERRPWQPLGCGAGKCSSFQRPEPPPRSQGIKAADRVRGVFEELTKQLTDSAFVPATTVQQMLLRMGHCLDSVVLNDLVVSVADSEFVLPDMPRQFDFEACMQLLRECEERWGKTPSVPVYVFVNPSSGGRLAARWLELPESVRVYDMRSRSSVASGASAASEEAGSVTCTRLQVFSLTDGKPGNKPGFLEVLDMTQEEAAKPQGLGSKVRVIVAGGDGTVNWVLSELDRHGIDSKWVALGVAGYGTGNDFSRVLGWGSGPPLTTPDDVNRLHGLVSSWMDADEVMLDLWQTTTRTYPTGSFSVVQKDGSLGLTAADIARLNIQSDNGCQWFTRFFVNYFSMGVVAQIGASFEQQRCKSRAANMLVYAREGFLKATKTKTNIKVDKVLEDMADAENMVFSTQQDAPPELRPSANILSLIFLNIPSMAGGSDLWKRASALTVPGASCFRNWRQDFGDGHLETMTFSSATAFIKEKLGPALHGNGRRLHSGRGPFRVRFRDARDEEYAQELAKTGGLLFMQADGEYFAVSAPASTEVRWSRSITVLQRAQGGLDLAAAELFRDAVRLLHFLEYAKRRGEHDAVKVLFAAAALRGSGSDAASSKEYMEAEAALYAKLCAPVLDAYQADPDGRPAALQCSSPESSTSKRKKLPQELREKLTTWHDRLGETVDEEDPHFAFAISAIRGISLALQLEERTLGALLDKEGPHEDLTEVARTCLQRWCGPDVDVDTLQSNYVRRFEVPRPGHFLCSPCEIPFLFEDVAPDVFRRLRTLAGLDDQTYRNALGCEDLNFITFANRPSSGENFFFSHDKQFIVKTLSRGQAHKLVEMLPSYERHLIKNPDSLLVRYLGLHRLKPSQDPGDSGEVFSVTAARFFVVMGNILLSPCGLDEAFDLKGLGSPLARRGSIGTGDPHAPHHETDWYRRLGRIGPLRLPAEESARLLAQHVADTALLESFGICNYSILLGIRSFRVPAADDSFSGLDHHDADRLGGGCLGPELLLSSAADSSFTRTSSNSGVTRTSSNSGMTRTSSRSERGARLLRDGLSALRSANRVLSGSSSPPQTPPLQDRSPGRSGFADSTPSHRRLLPGAFCGHSSGSTTTVGSDGNRIEQTSDRWSFSTNGRARLSEAIGSEDGNEMYFIGITSILSSHARRKDGGNSLSDPVQYRLKQAAFFRKVVGVGDPPHIGDVAEDSFGETMSPRSGRDSFGSGISRTSGRVGHCLSRFSRQRSSETGMHTASSSDTE